MSYPLCHCTSLRVPDLGMRRGGFVVIAGAIKKKMIQLCPHFGTSKWFETGHINFNPTDVVFPASVALSNKQSLEWWQAMYIKSTDHRRLSSHKKNYWQSINAWLGGATPGRGKDTDTFSFYLLFYCMWISGQGSVYLLHFVHMNMY